MKRPGLLSNAAAVLSPRFSCRLRALERNIALSTLALPSAERHVGPGYRIERPEVRAASWANSGFAQIKFSSRWN